MADTPRNRHSRTEKDPVTLDLEAERVAQDEKSADLAGPAEAESETGSSAESSSRPPAAGEKPPRRTSLAALLGAGVAGGVIALAAGAALQFYGVLPENAREAGPDYGPTIERLAEDLAQLESALSGFREQGADRDARLESAAAEVAALRQELANLPEPAAGDESMIARIDALERAIPAGSNGEVVTDDALAGLRNEIAEARNAARTALETAQGNSTLLAGLREEIGGVSSRLEREAANPEVAVAIAAVALKSAVDSGAPFTLQLDTYASVTPDSEEIEALRAMAATGVPSREQIASEASEATNRIIEVTHRVDPDADLAARALAGLRSLVKVRPVGVVEGNAPEAIAARMEAAIAERDYAKAIAEYESLPEEAQQAGAEFIGMVRARMEADQLIDRALAAALRAAG